jgi:hypothetical protein
MTVQELLKSLSFNDIVSALQKTHYPDRHVGQFAMYKEAYDQLCNIPFEGKGGKVSFDITKKENLRERGVLPIVARNVEGDYWKNTVGKTVVKPKNNPFTDAELAGAILWGCTFYGYTPRTRRDCFDNMFRNPHTKYGEQAKRLMIKKELLYATDKDIYNELKAQMKEPRMSFALSMEGWELLDTRKLHRNRSKRKRDYRISSRIDWLMKMDKRQHLVNELQSNLPEAQTKILADLILGAKDVHEYWIESHIYGNDSVAQGYSPRVAYLIELISTYATEILDEIQNKKVVENIIATSSKEHLISEVEQQQLTDFLQAFFRTTECVLNIYFGLNDAMGEDIQLHFIELSMPTK